MNLIIFLGCMELIGHMDLYRLYIIDNLMYIDEIRFELIYIYLFIIIIYYKYIYLIIIIGRNLFILCNFLIYFYFFLISKLYYIDFLLKFGYFCKSQII